MPRKKKLSFEEALSEIDIIINKLENGELNLEDSLKVYEESSKLLKFCNETLESAEGKVKKVSEINGEIKEEDFN